MPAQAALADGTDCAVIVTNYASMDYAAISRRMPVVVAARNSPAGMDGAHIFTLLSLLGVIRGARASCNRDDCCRDRPMQTATAHPASGALSRRGPNGICIIPAGPASWQCQHSWSADRALT